MYAVSDGVECVTVKRGPKKQGYIGGNPEARSPRLMVFHLVELLFIFIAAISVNLCSLGVRWQIEQSSMQPCFKYCRKKVGGFTSSQGYISVLLANPMEPVSSLCAVRG